MTAEHLTIIGPERIYFSYSSFAIYDSAEQRPGCAWTKTHGLQGFARRDSTVNLQTLLEFGFANLQAFTGTCALISYFQRVISVPLAIPSGVVIIEGPEEKHATRKLIVEAGHYRVVTGQRILNEQEQEIHIYFEHRKSPLLASEILVADPGLSPPRHLIETADVIPK